MRKKRISHSPATRGLAPGSRAWITGFLLIIRGRQLGSLFARAQRKLTGQKAQPGPNSALRIIPRHIWMYWDKGEAAAPAVVQACITSWRRQNPGWDVHVLSAQDACAVAGLPEEMMRKLPVQSFADLLRLRLLRQNGGVWADATLYCVTPLDHWLPVVAQKGFFAFSWTNSDNWMIWPNLHRRLTNWFLVSEPEGTVIATWEAYAIAYLQDRTIPHVYYWPHLLIDWMRLRHRSFAAALNAMPRLGSFAPHLVYSTITRNGDDTRVRELLQAGVAPVQKLRWNWDDPTAQRALAMLNAPGPQS